MKKIFIFCMFLTAGAAHAQLKGFSIGPYGEKAWPMGNFETRYGNGIGAGIGGDIKLPGRFGLTGSVGIMRFGGKTIQHAGGVEDVKALMATPLRIGIKYRLPLVYLKLESGNARLNDGNGGGFILSPGIGIRILGLDVQAKYETWIRGGKSYNFTGVRAAYNF